MSAVFDVAPEHLVARARLELPHRRPDLGVAAATELGDGEAEEDGDEHQRRQRLGDPLGPPVPYRLTSRLTSRLAPGRVGVVPHGHQTSQVIGPVMWFVP